MTDLSERLLVLRCQAGDESAFRQLYDAFSGRTLRYLRGVIDDDAAEDVQQEVWLGVYRRIRDLANPGGFRTWLYATTRSRAIDHLRRQRRWAELEEISAREGPAGPLPAEPPDFDRGPDDKAVTAALEMLSPVHREVLLLRYWSDLSYAEIALVLGCSIGTVRSRLHNAKARMADALGSRSDLQQGSMTEESDVDA